MFGFRNLALLSIWSAIINAISRPALVDFHSGGILELVQNGIGANYIIWFSLLAASRKLWTPSPSDNKEQSPFQILYLYPILIFQLLPSASISWFAASYGGFILLLNERTKPLLRLAVVLIICTSLREPLTSLFLKIFNENILNADTLFTSAILTIMGYSHYFNANIIMLDTSQPLLILTGCSVFTNLSFSSLLWLAIHVAQDRLVTRYSLLFLLLILILTTFANSVRLAFMSLSKSNYIFYHDGLGADFFQWGLFLLTLILTLIGCYYAPPKQNISIAITP